MTRAKPILLAVLAASVLLVGAAGGATAQPDRPDDGDAGPPDDLPGPVPEFVGDVLGAVGDFLSGSLDRLGETVSGLTPGDGADERAGGDADGGA